MRKILAIILPPVAVLSCGKLLGAMVNLLLTLCGWVPGVMHAMNVVVLYEIEKVVKRDGEKSRQLIKAQAELSRIEMRRESERMRRAVRIERPRETIRVKLPPPR